MLKIKFPSLALYVVFSCLLIDIFIIFDVPILRQIFGFVFLVFLPGFLILSILDIKSDYLTKVLLSWGISVSFLILFGFFLNNILLFFGYQRPLSTGSLLFIFNVVYFILLFTIFIFKKEYFFKDFSLNLFFEKLKLNTFDKLLLILPFLFPTIGVFGVHVMNTINNNSLLISLFFLISIYIIIISLFNQKVSNKIYPFVIYSISISIIILLPLRSNHLIGIDTHIEYFFFKTTLNNLYWKPFAYSTLDSTLSISLLPVIFQSILKMPSEFLFKILYPLIYSVSPLIVYMIVKKYVQEIYAFLSSCFFMFQWIFIWTEYNARTSLAVLFFMFAMLVLFDDRIISSKKKFLFLLFTASCVVSHYSTTYMFFFITISTYLIVELLSTRYKLKNSISPTYPVLFFALIFFWYSLMTEKAFISGVHFIKSTVLNLTNFLADDARSAQALSVLGNDITQKGIPHKIEFVFTWLHFSLIGLGIGNLFINYKKMSFIEIYVEKFEFLKQKFEVTYSLLSILCTILLIIMVSLPFVSKGYGMDRLYQFSITILSVFFILGAIFLSKYVKISPLIIILFVLIPYFLSVTGVTYNIFDVHRSILLNSHGEQYDIYFVHDHENIGANWIKKYNESDTTVYTDTFGRHILLSQAMYSRDSIDNSALLNGKNVEGLIFLRYYNIKFGVLKGKNGNICYLDDCNSLTKSNLIYKNGGSEVYI